MQNVIQRENGQGSKELALMVFQIAEKPGRILEEASSPSVVSSLFQPDTILLLQYFEMLRRKSHLEGEKKLMLAVLEDAVACFQKYHAARDKKGKGLFHEVQEWLMDEKDDWVFSFRNICESLGINPEYLRRGLVQWREKQTSREKTYYFCGKGCKVAFDKEPEKYLSGGRGHSHCG